MAVTENEKDLRVCVTSDLKYTQKCIEAEKKFMKILGNIKIQLSYRNEISCELVQDLVRVQLKYCVQVCSP